MKLESAGSVFGAYVHDIDLNDLTSADVAKLDDAWAEYGVLFIRDQQLTPQEHLAFAERFASIDVNQFFRPVDGHPGIAEVLKERDQTVNIGGGWHTDHSYDDEPARGSILLARETPPVGGDTCFASVGAAYDDLSDGLKKILRQLRVRHSNRHVFGAAAGYGAKPTEGRVGNPEAVRDTEHPAVVLHPITGRELLYVNPTFATGFVGWTDEESAPLLRFLYDHVVKDKYVHRFVWEPGSIAMWDNRSTWHLALNDYDGHRRLMHRITVAGQPLSGVG